MYSNDTPKKLIAKYHEQKSSGLFRRRDTQAWIEIFLDPAKNDLPEDLLDMIIVTFAFLESKRVRAAMGTPDLGEIVYGNWY
jgi:hypothetical protein